MAEASYPPPPPPSSSGSVTEARTNRESIRKGLDELKRFASTNFSRARQFVTEKAGKADAVTEFDTEYETLCAQFEQIKIATEHMVNHVTAIIEPNPNIRLEDWTYTKLNRTKPTRPNSHILLSSQLDKSSVAFGQETQYGAFLKRCSEVECKLGESQKRFQDKATNSFITPLKAFLEIDVKNVMRGRKVLNMNRLDLDAYKAQAKKAAPGPALDEAERDLRIAQADFDSQLRKVRNDLKKIVDTHMNHMGYLKTFMTAQREYHSECQALLADLEAEPMRSLSLSKSGHGTSAVSHVGDGKFIVFGIELDREDTRKARVLYDYDADNDKELTVKTGELISVTTIPDDDDFLMAERDGKYGKIPSNYISKL